MLKKILLASLFFLPSLAFAQRFGSIKTSNDVSLSTNTVLNQPTLQTGATAYPEIINAQRGTILGTGNYPTATSADLTFSSTFGTGKAGLKLYNTSAYFAGNFAAILWTGPTSGGNSTEKVYNTIKAGEGKMQFGSSYFPFEIDTRVTDPVYNFGGAQGSGLNSTTNLCFDGTPPYVTGTSKCIEWDDANNRFLMYGDYYFPESVSTLNFVAVNIIGSNTGQYNFAGTTITFAAPAIDSSDRIPILNSGAISWPLAVTDGARLGTNQTFTGANIYNTTGTVVFNSTVTLMAILKDNTGSAGTAGWPLTSNGGTAPPTYQAPASGWTGTATSGLNMATFTVTNVPSIAWADSGGGWISRASTHSVVTATFTIPNSTWSIANLQFAMVANSTYSFTAHVIWSVSGSAPSGARFGVSVPAGVGTVLWSQGGAGASATAANFSQKGSAPTDFTTTAAGAAASQTWSVDITGVVMTGTNGAGSLNVQMAPASAGTTYTLQPGTQITGWKDQ